MTDPPRPEAAKPPAGMRMPASATSAAQLTDELLALTLRHAVAHSPFYAERLDGLWTQVRSAADLGILPLLRKADLRERLDELKTFAGAPDHLMYSSGTAGESMQVPVLQAEIDVADAFYRLWQERGAGVPPLTLTVPRPIRGTHIRNPAFPTIACSVVHGLDRFVDMLSTSHWVGGRRVAVRNLEINLLNLRRVTRELLEQGVHPRSFGVAVISVSGQYVTAWERAYYADIWGALVTDRYGLSEVRGDAKWCAACERYHFDLGVIAEILDPDSLEPIGEGVGCLVLTGLYPFNQAVPKIRYFVEDLVEMTTTSCASSQLGMRFLARIGDAVPAPPGSAHRYRLFATDLAEVLAPLPDVARKPKTTLQKFRLSATPEGEARIEVELTYPPALFPERVDELDRRLLAALRGRCPALGRPTVRFLGPGSLGRITKL